VRFRTFCDPVEFVPFAIVRHLICVELVNTSQYVRRKYAVVVDPAASGSLPHSDLAATMDTGVLSEHKLYDTGAKKVSNFLLCTRNTESQVMPDIL
jgi:hypothetical protein